MLFREAMGCLDLKHLHYQVVSERRNVICLKASSHYPCCGGNRSANLLLPDRL